MYSSHDQQPNNSNPTYLSGGEYATNSDGNPYAMNQPPQNPTVQHVASYNPTSSNGNPFPSQSGNSYPQQAEFHPQMQLAPFTSQTFNGSIPQSQMQGVTAVQSVIMQSSNSSKYQYANQSNQISQSQHQSQQINAAQNIQSATVPQQEVLRSGQSGAYNSRYQNMSQEQMYSSQVQQQGYSSQVQQQGYSSQVQQQGYSTQMQHQNHQPLYQAPQQLTPSQPPSPAPVQYSSAPQRFVDSNTMQLQPHPSPQATVSESTTVVQKHGNVVMKDEWLKTGYHDGQWNSLQVHAIWARINDRMVLSVRASNLGAQPIHSLTFAFSPNSFGLDVKCSPGLLQPSQTITSTLALSFTRGQIMEPVDALNVQIRYSDVSVKALNITTFVPLHIMFVEEPDFEVNTDAVPRLSQSVFLAVFPQLPEHTFGVPLQPWMLQTDGGVNVLNDRLVKNNVYVVAHRTQPVETYFVSFCIPPPVSINNAGMFGISVLGQLQLKGNSVEVTLKSNAPSILPSLQRSFTRLLSMDSSS